MLDEGCMKTAVAATTLHQSWSLPCATVAAAQHVAFVMVRVVSPPLCRTCR